MISSSFEDPEFKPYCLQTNKNMDQLLIFHNQSYYIVGTISLDSRRLEIYISSIDEIKE